MSKWNSVLLSFFVPGAGQAAVHRWRRCAMWLFFFALGSLAFLWLLITPVLASPWLAVAWFGILVAAWIVMLIDAWHLPEGSDPGSMLSCMCTVASFFIPGLGQAIGQRWKTAGLWASGYAALFILAYFSRFNTATAWLSPCIFMIGVPIVRWLSALNAYQIATLSTREFEAPHWMAVGAVAIVNLMILIPGLGFLSDACFGVVQIGGDSMKPTLTAPMIISDTTRNKHPIKLIGGDRVIVDKFTYRLRKPRLGEVVLLTSTRSHRSVLRVAGMPNQMVQIIPPFLMIDGRKVIDPPIFRKIAEDAHGTAGYRIPAGKHNIPVILGDDEYYLLGDNSRSSLDSRTLGPYKRQFIQGRVTKICWPLHRAGESLGY